MKNLVHSLVNGTTEEEYSTAIIIYIPIHIAFIKKQLTIIILIDFFPFLL